jgi:hypothetical protein
MWRMVIAGVLALALSSAPTRAGADAPSPAPPPPVSLSDADARKLFEQGNQLFRDALERAKADKAGAAAHFRDAAAAWRTIAQRGGIRNAALEKNIANAELLAGDVPRAVVAFRRAQALDPFDATVRNGLAAARRAAGTDNLAPGARPSTEADLSAATGIGGAWRGVGRFLVDRSHQTLLYLPERPMFWGAAACYLIAFTLAALRTARVGRVPRWGAPILFLAAALCAGPLIARDLATTPEGVVVAAGIIARNGPADLYEPAFKEPLPAGLEVRIAETRQGWSLVRLNDGRSAWIPDAALEQL